MKIKICNTDIINNQRGLYRILVAGGCGHKEEANLWRHETTTIGSYL